MNQVIDKARILALSNRVDWLEENQPGAWSTSDAIQFTLSTDDMVDAALALRAQWAQQQSNTAGLKEPTTFETAFDGLLRNIVQSAVEDIEVSCG